MDSAQSIDSLSDAEIIKRVLGGDKESFGILFERYQELVYRRALIMLGDCDTAMDVVQEAFLIAYKNLERLRHPAAFGSWIAGITKNVCKNLRRDMKNTTVSLDYLAEIGIELRDPGKTPPGNEARMQAVKKFISTLSDKYREILELRYTENFSCKKIADFLGLSVSAVKSRLFYARNQILKRLKKEGWL